MPQSGMDLWVIAGVLAAILTLLLSWWRYMTRKPKTLNEIKGGSRNQQLGGAGSTVNRIEDGDDNQQSG